MMLDEYKLFVFVAFILVAVVMLVLNAGHNTSYQVKKTILIYNNINLNTTSGVNICVPVVFNFQTKPKSI